MLLDIDGHKPQILLRSLLVTATAAGALSLASCSKQTGGARFTCPRNPLLGVYNPSRLKVLAPCRWYRGTVVEVGDRSDGDTHMLVKPASGYARFLAVANVNDGGLVVEIMPGQTLPIPKPHEQVELFGTWVYDTHNDWNEIHPVWGIRYTDSGTAVFSLPPRHPIYNGNAKD